VEAAAAVVKSCIRFAFVSIAGTALGVCECQPEQLSVLFGGVGLGQKKKKHQSKYNIKRKSNININDRTISMTRQHRRQNSINDKTASNQKQHQLKHKIKDKTLATTKRKRRGSMR
jgi:hypothetical protein